MRGAPLALAAMAWACGPSLPPPVPPTVPPPLEAAPPPPPERLDAGSPCVYAEARCEAGTCRVEVHNECDAAIRCELAVSAGCDGELGEGRASDELPVDTAGAIEASVPCAGEVSTAAVDALRCR